MKIGDRVEVLACGNCAGVGWRCSAIGEKGKIRSYIESFDQFFVVFDQDSIGGGHFPESELKTIEKDESLAAQNIRNAEKLWK